MSSGHELFLSQSFLTEVRTNCSSLVSACLWVDASVSLPVGFNLVNRLKVATRGSLSEDKGVGFAHPV